MSQVLVWPKGQFDFINLKFQILFKHLRKPNIRNCGINVSQVLVWPKGQFNFINLKFQILFKHLSETDIWTCGINVSQVLVLPKSKLDFLNLKCDLLFVKLLNKESKLIPLNFQHEGGITRLDVYQSDNLENFLHLWTYSKSSQSDEWISGQIPLIAIQNEGYEYRVSWNPPRFLYKNYIYSFPVLYFYLYLIFDVFYIQVICKDIILHFLVIRNGPNTYFYNFFKQASS